MLKIAQDREPLPERSGYAIDQIHTIEQKTDSVSCTAVLMKVYEKSTVFMVDTVSYSAVEKPDGQWEVTVHGLP